jgi:hypothetical protein
MMGDTFSASGRDLVRSDIEPPVYLHGVAVDNLSLEKVSEMDGCPALPYPGGAQDDDKVFAFSFQFGSKISGPEV